jgi:hypothetical protein
MDTTITVNTMKKNEPLNVQNIPVLLTLHVRSKLLEKQLSLLKRAGVKRVFISVDGPRDDEDKRNQDEIDKIINSYRQEFSDFRVRKFDENKGIAIAIISAIDWFFSANTYGIIFEDDIDFEMDALLFFSKALAEIENMPSVLLVSGVQPFKKSRLNSQVVFTNYPQIWGWATYANKWIEMKKYIYRMPPNSQKIDLATIKFWQVGWLRVHRGYLDTWDLPIATGMLFANKFCMLPPVNLTSNVGADNHSTNTHKNGFPLGIKIENVPLNLNFDSPINKLEVNELNTKFEREIYNIRWRNIFSLQFTFLDRLRFGKNRKSHLIDRLILIEAP